MNKDFAELFHMIYRSRKFEDLIIELWEKGKISGEMHTGRGEEVIIASVVSQLEEGDAMALDHRGTAPLIMRGVDPVKILYELLGDERGLSRGKGGHMHLFSKDHLAASSGIVGASGPAGAGFALSAKFIRKGKIAISFFGEGSLNQGMMMESLNLSKAWELPLLFVCKDDNYSITENSSSLRGGSIKSRALGFGLEYFSGNGLDPEEFYPVAQSAIEYVRNNKKPAFLHAGCIHLDGHFLGFQLLRIMQKPFNELPKISFPLIKQLFSPKGGGPAERLKGMKKILEAIINAATDPARKRRNDPVKITEKIIAGKRIDPEPVKREVLNEISGIRSSIEEGN